MFGVGTVCSMSPEANPSPERPAAEMCRFMTMSAVPAVDVERFGHRPMNRSSLGGGR
jgi:hypothetical protein